MPFNYISDPVEIENKSFRMIRELVDLTNYDKVQQQVVMRVIHSLGMPHLANQIRFSKNACSSGLNALNNQQRILCDVEMVKQGITKRMIQKEPLCFLNNEVSIKLAKTRHETRTMAALSLWEPFLKSSIVIIGNAPTALFRLLEMIEQGADKPALIIGMPVGFVGAEESKQALWEAHSELGIECITLLGREGGSAVSAATCNALLRCNQNQYY